MRLSRQGAGAILGYEAVYLYSYPDPGTGGEPWTIGAGHTSAAGGPRVAPGMVWSLRRCLEVFLADMARVESRVTGTIKRDLRQNVFDGFASFDFNTGALVSGSVDNRWNAGDEPGALAVLSKYVNAGGHFMQGLANRRASEVRMIRDGVYPKSVCLVQSSRGMRGQSVSTSSLPWPDTPAIEIAADVPISTPPLPVRKEADNFIVRFVQWLWSFIT